MSRLFPALAVSLGLIAAITPPARATEWLSEHLRGLKTHMIGEAGVQLRLICGPDRAYGADNAALRVTSAGSPVEGEIAVVFDAPDARAIRMQASNGSALRSMLPAEDWAALVESFASGTDFALVSARMKPVFRSERGLSARCY